AAIFVVLAAGGRSCSQKQRRCAVSRRRLAGRLAGAAPDAGGIFSARGFSGGDARLPARTIRFAPAHARGFESRTELYSPLVERKRFSKQKTARRRRFCGRDAGGTPRIRPRRTGRRGSGPGPFFGFYFLCRA